jgi:hypothetical protein
VVAQETDSKVVTPVGTAGLDHDLPPLWLTTRDIPSIVPTAMHVDDTQLTSPRPAVVCGKVETFTQGVAVFATSTSLRPRLPPSAEATP